MRRRQELRVDACRDGALSTADRRRMEELLESDPECARRMRETDDLGRAVRAAWTDGPPPPSLSTVIGALRPALARADAEREAERGWLDRLRQSFGPIPAVAFAGAVAVMMVFSWPTLMGDGIRERESARTQVAQIPAAGDQSVTAVDAPTAIYDLAQEESPLMIFEAEDGSTIIWILQEEESVSIMPAAASGGWV